MGHLISMAKTAYQAAESRAQRIEIAKSRILVDWTGNPIKKQSSVYQGSLPAQTWNAPRIIQSQNHNQDFNKNVSTYEWNTILSRAREIYANLGGVKNAICEIGDLATGDAWGGKYTGEDEEWGKIASEYLNNWFEICDVRGQPYSFNRMLRLATISVERDGDCLCVLSTTPDGTGARLQWIPAHSIGSRQNGLIKEGAYKGNNSFNGIIFNKAGIPVAYNIRGEKEDGSQDSRISVRDAHLLFDPEYVEQGRGLSSLAAAVVDWDMYKQIRYFEMMGIKAASNFAYKLTLPPEEIEDETGSGNYPSWPGGPAQVTGSRNAWVEELQGGEVPVFSTENQGKIEVLESNRPSNNTQAFLLDHVLRHAFLSLRWPLELSYDLNSRGATTKLAAVKAQRRIEGTQARVLYPLWKRVAGYAISKAINSGYIPMPKDQKDWKRFEPDYPRSFTLDQYKDTKSDIESYNRGWITGTQVAASCGYDLHANLVQKDKEISDAKAIAAKSGNDWKDILSLNTQVQVAEVQAAPFQSDNAQNN